MRILPDKFSLGRCVWLLAHGLLCVLLSLFVVHEYDEPFSRMPWRLQVGVIGFWGLGLSGALLTLIALIRLHQPFIESRMQFSMGKVLAVEFMLLFLCSIALMDDGRVILGSIGLNLVLLSFVEEADYPKKATT